MLKLCRAVLIMVQKPLASFSPVQPADAVVILGSPIGKGGRLSPIAEERAAAGVEIWRRNLAPVICITGGRSIGARSDTISESEGIADWIRRMGVPEGSLRVDHSATDTRENALRSAELLLGEGRKRVWLVTQPFHLRRARYHFRRAGFEPLGWHIEDSLQYREPARALRWVLREYAAWALLLLLPPPG
jgi:uncharacterized SAM-binding protein YcdF (DUF218 family)